MKLVGTQLVHQTDAASFLAHVQNNSTTLGFDGAHRAFELIAAIAAQRSKCIAGQTLGMHAGQKVLPVADRTLDERHMMLAAQAINVGVAVNSPHLVGILVFATHSTSLSWRLR